MLLFRIVFKLIVVTCNKIIYFNAYCKEIIKLLFLKIPNQTNSMFLQEPFSLIGITFYKIIYLYAFCKNMIKLLFLEIPNQTNSIFKEHKT